jgi:hypothetical protein
MIINWTGGANIFRPRYSDPILLGFALPAGRPSHLLLRDPLPVMGVLNLSAYVTGTGVFIIIVLL